MASSSDNLIDSPSSFLTKDSGPIALPAASQAAPVLVAQYDLPQRRGLMRLQCAVGAAGTLDALQVRSGAFAPSQNPAAITQTDLSSLADYQGGTRMCPACPGLTALPGQAAGSTFAIVLDASFFGGTIEIWAGSTAGTTLQVQVQVSQIVETGGN